jgi:N-acetylmuramoyl-L-alanine amidase CwlA
MSNLNIIQNFIPSGNRNRPGRANPMNFVTVHETGNTRAGANARAHASFLNNPNTTVSYHYSVDDAETVQHLPENEDGFHAGDGGGNGNRQSIGIEICVNSDGNFQKAIDRTVTLVADICKRHNIPIENIRQHFDWSRKNCPQNIRAARPHNWETFINKVRAAMSENDSPSAPPVPNHTPSDWAKAAWEWGIANKITDGTNPQGMQLMFNFHKRFMTGVG